MDVARMEATMRIGFGYDVHALAPGESLVIGGVSLEHELGTVAYSDGDVLAHAIIDALLGAAAKGDIGTHFPSSDDRYKGIASTVLLSETVDLLARHHWRAIFVDATILAERPVLKPFMDQIRRSLATSLGLTIDSVNVKATTTDHLGFIGRGEGIGSTAIATVERAE